MPRKSKKWKGIRRHGAGWQTNVRVNGTLIPKTWSLDTDVDTMATWIADQKTRHATKIDGDQTFAAQVVKFLKKREGMPSHGKYAYNLNFWIAKLGGDRSMRSITDDDISAVLRELLFGKYKKGTVRDRRGALSTFFNTMDPKGANPVRSSLRIKQPKPESRGRDYATVERILAAMPTLSKNRGNKTSLSRLRARVVAYTGIPPGMLGQIPRHDLNLDARTVRLEERAKGEGVEARTLPLSDRGVDAFRAFDAANAYGRFDVSGLRRTIKNACRNAGVDPKTFRLYDLRHSFLSQLYRSTKDLATVGRFAMHAPGSPLTARYAQAANVDVDRTAAASFSTAVADVPVATPPVHVSRQKLPTKVASIRKAS